MNEQGLLNSHQVDKRIIEDYGSILRFLEEEKGGYINLHIFSAVAYANQKFHVIFSDMFIPFISSLSKFFTKYPLEYLANMKSFHSHRIFEIILEKTGSKPKNVFAMSVEELRTMLDFKAKYIKKNGKYDNTDFKFHVLDKAVKDISECFY